MKSARIDIFNHARLATLYHKLLLPSYAVKMCFCGIQKYVL